MKRAGIVAVFLVVVVFVGLPLVRFIQDQNRDDADVAATPVVFARPALREVEETQRYAGRLTADSTVRVFPKGSGKVTSVLVRENEEVRAGQVVIALEDDVQRLQMEQARAAWQAAEAQYQKASTGARSEELESARASLAQSERDLVVAQSSLERQRSLFEAGSISRAQLDNAENAVSGAETRLANARRSLRLLETGAREEDLRAARAQADSARKQYELAQLQFDNTRIESPLAGTVVSILTEPGNTVGPQTPVAVVVNDNLMYAEFTVPERSYGRLAVREGDAAVRVYPLAYPDLPPLPGGLTTVSRVIDASTRTFSAEAAVENSGGILRPGMYVEVELILDRRENAVVIPAAAVVQRAGERVVFVAGADTAEQPPVARALPVTTGIRADGYVEITSGLIGTERVVVEGNAFLEDGQRVREISGAP